MNKFQKKKLKQKKENKLTFRKTLQNDWYALKMGYSFSKSLVINAFIMEALGYFEWVFFDAIFLREIVNGLDNQVGFPRIFAFILICGAFFALTNLQYNYGENVVIPLEMTKLYGGIYRKLYAKAKNVELRCYEDAEFYNKYTMAMDGADEKVYKIITSFCGIFSGVFATAAVFWFMFQIDHYAVLFIICPLLGNFLFGNLKNKYEFKRYQEQAPNDKVLNYVNRVMYLPDYAKEVRLSNIFRLLRRQYHDATTNNVKVAKKYAFVNAHMNFWRIHLLHQRGDFLPVCSLGFPHSHSCHDAYGLTIGNIGNRVQRRVSVRKLFQLGIKLRRFCRDKPCLFCIVSSQFRVAPFKLCNLLLLGLDDVVVLFTACRRRSLLFLPPAHALGRF